MNRTDIVQGYSRLKALREHVPGPCIEVKYVVEFHSILDLLERASGVSLAGFRIPDSELVPQIAAVRPGRPPTYTDEPHCERAFFEMKVDGVLTMFELELQSGAGAQGVIFKPRG